MTGHGDTRRWWMERQSCSVSGHLFAKPSTASQPAQPHTHSHTNFLLLPLLLLLPFRLPPELVPLTPLGQSQRSKLWRGERVTTGRGWASGQKERKSLWVSSRRLVLFGGVGKRGVVYTDLSQRWARVGSLSGRSNLLRRWLRECGD